ncbi:hypothetical protein [Archangium lansingense]|uniref:Uncharacterized protein n=1 Tax=Archangium lansingense TaxID=2995310 RepID=A0ABT3ZYG7_9BACT|nr:hypothetical protein [Archangium lansinium]MCY1074442.1 hypothetical protein [Archangium lansinium]
MFESQRPFRALYESLLAYEGRRVSDEVLGPWLARNGAERTWLRELGARPGEPWPTMSDEDLCRLYAVSRVNDVLLLRFQPLRREGWHGLDLRLEEYISFLEALGFVRVEHGGFHPFFHEIVSVQASEQPVDGIALVESRWPCFMLGDLMFSRAGVTARAGARELVPAIAESSPLYWAHRRANRPTTDLSVGWGSNSQWRTQFRRDYRRGGTVCFNVDGRLAPHAPLTAKDAERLGGLTPEERVELLVHRCFVRTRKADNDLWPYDDTLTLSL